MYGKYMLFYESPKTGDIYAHAQTVCTRPLLGEEGPGNEAKNKFDSYMTSCTSKDCCVIQDVVYTANKL